MSTPHQNEERRVALRMALRFPLVVSGRTEDGAAWSDPTETDDISTIGASFHLNQKVSIGDTLYVRAHQPDGSSIEAVATIVRQSPAIYGTARLGVQIIDKSDAWTRLFVSWVPDQQSASSGQSRPLVKFGFALYTLQHYCPNVSRTESVTWKRQYIEFN